MEYYILILYLFILICLVICWIRSEKQYSIKKEKFDKEMNDINKKIEVILKDIDKIMGRD